MSENAAPQKHGAGDDISSSSSADVRVQRDALLTEELAENCDMKMFMLHADGSHLSQVRSVAARPISEELFAAQAFVLAVDWIHAHTCAVTACSFDFAVSGQSFRALLAAIGIIIFMVNWNDCAPPHQLLIARAQSIRARD